MVTDGPEDVGVAVFRDERSWQFSEECSNCCCHCIHMESIQ